MLPRSRSDLDAIRAECRALVNTRAGLSSFAAVVPVPGVDVGTDITLLLEMIPAINRRFGLSYEQMEALEPGIREFALVTATSLGSQMIGRAITRQVVVGVLRSLGIRVATKSLARWVPVVGQAVAATISYGVMRHIGNAHIEDCYQVALRSMRGREVIHAEVVETKPARPVRRLR